MIAILFFLSFIFLLLAILFSEILIPSTIESQVALPGIGFGESFRTRSCSIYQTYSVDTAIVDDLTPYPIFDKACLDGTIRALEKITTTCEKEVGCIVPYTGQRVNFGQTVSFYQPCGNIPLCQNLSINLLTGGNCINLERSTITSPPPCSINETYLLENGKIRIPIQPLCLNTNLSFVPCDSAPTWQFSQNTLSSGNIFLSTIGNSITTTVDRQGAAEINFRFGQ